MRLNQVPEWFRQTKEGKAAVAAAAGEVRTARAVLLQSIETERSKLVAALTALDKDLEAASAVYAKARETLTDAQRRLVEASHARDRAVRTCDMVVERAEAELRRTADAGIEALWSELYELNERVRRDPVTRNVTRATMSSPGQSETDGASIKERMALIRSAMEECTALKLAADGDVTPALDAIRERVGMPRPQVAA